MVKGILYRIKKYVSVISRTEIDGTIRPISIDLDNDTWIIDEVLNVQHAPARKVGGKGMRYLVRIDKHETFLFYENPLWFVELKIPDPNPPDESLNYRS